jgi:dTDP-4-amino-4,6-dideoxygalactose transaminase
MVMKKIEDYLNPFNAILDFEQAIAEFTGAPYCVTTDCCTHALEIVFRLNPPTALKIPAKTYLSVVMLMHKLNISYELTSEKWNSVYQFKGSNVWDYARKFKQNMFVKGTIQCLSFGRTKPLQIGRGGCILTDDVNLYNAASMMRSDGRDMFSYKNWADQKKFKIGYHYTLKPEECIVGMNLLESKTFVEQIDKFFDYPDCREIVIE